MAYKDLKKKRYDTIQKLNAQNPHLVRVSTDGGQPDIMINKKTGEVFRVDSDGLVGGSTNTVQVAADLDLVGVSLKYTQSEYIINKKTGIVFGIKKTQDIQQIPDKHGKMRHYFSDRMCQHLDLYENGIVSVYSGTAEQVVKDLSCMGNPDAKCVIIHTQAL